MSPLPVLPVSHADPEDEAPWAMQLVLRVEKSAPPSRTEACEASARAVVTLLSQPECLPDGEFFPEVERWLSGRIRKHARRARGAAWEKVQQLPGLTVAHAGAEVRALVPRSTANLPPAIAKLQLSGSELEDPNQVSAVAVTPGGPVVVSITPTPFLPLGKATAAAGHAAQLAAMQMETERRSQWATAGYPVSVEHPSLATFRTLQESAQVAVRDAGFTVVKSGTVTSLARWE